jgi:hypothetical protein
LKRFGAPLGVVSRVAKQCHENFLGISGWHKNIFSFFKKLFFIGLTADFHWLQTGMKNER